MHDSVSELFEEWAKPTEEKQPQATANPAFTSDAPPEIVKENKSPEVEPEPVIELSAEMIENSADMSIGLADVVQSGVFTWLINRKKNAKIISLYGNDAVDKLEHLINEQDAEKNNKLSQRILREFTADENGMLRLAREVNKMVENIPFTDAEKEAIKIPLMALMKEKGGHLSPTWALTFAAFQIFGSRAMQTFQL